MSLRRNHACRPVTSGRDSSAIPVNCRDSLPVPEPPILELVTARILESDKPWSKARLPLVVDRVRDRLGQLSARLGDAEWLDGAFSAGDLMMVSVLLRVKPSGILDEYPNLAAYVVRGATRPASKRH